MTFESLGLTGPVLEGVADAGYDSPTEIQERAVPLAVAGSDLIALGQTGSGKTAAFGLPLLERLQGGEPSLRAVILVPTRELCVQVAENLRIYAAHTGLHVRTAFGGIPIGIQEAALRRGVDVLVACPGRLIDHLQIKTITLDDVQSFVLDEADRMLDMGFMPQIRRILARLPQKRQNMMFSATMPTEIEHLVANHFGKAEIIQVGRRSSAATTITHRFESMKPQDKEPWLERKLRDREGTVLVFVKTKKRAEEIGRQLQRARLPVDSIHGDKSAESRHVVLKAFERGKIRFMVATDVAARGLDVSNIGLVVNFDMPHAVEDYIHRVGRTGRAGSEGEALTLVSRADGRMQDAIIRHLEKTSEGHARAIVDGREVLTPKTVRKGERSDRDDDRDDGREMAVGEREDDRDDREQRKPRGRGRDNGREENREERKPRGRRRDEGRDERREQPREDERPAEAPKKRRRRVSVEAVDLGRKVENTDADFGFGTGLDDSSAGDEPRRGRGRRS